MYSPKNLEPEKVKDKRKVAGLKNTMNSIWQNLRDGCGPSVYHLLFASASSEMVSVEGQLSVMNPNGKFSVLNIVTMYGGDTTVCNREPSVICKTQWRLRNGLGLHLNQWCWGSCQNWWKTMQYHLENVWLATAVKAYLGSKTHYGTLSVMDWPPRSRDLIIEPV